ncbi:MAG: YvrJ family protein [Candidatus Micrarchaeaceae archaeon]
MNRLDINLIQQLISSLGFPIFVAVYLLWREEKKLEKLEDIIQQNTLVLQKLCEKLDEVKKI